MQVVDVTNWQKLGDNPFGNREKFWIRNPDACEVFLFKKPKTPGERIGEVASFYIGRDLFHLNMAETSFAIMNQTEGSISKSFVQEDYEFQEIVEYFGEDFDEKNLNEYTLKKALEISAALNIEKDFFAMCLFDYLIANQDRHVQNWGILTNKNNSEKTLAPLYDNGSSLFSGFLDERLGSFLTDQNEFGAYTRRAKSLFFLETKRPKFIEILKILIKEDNKLFQEAFEIFRTVKKTEIYELMLKIGVSKIRSQLISDLIVYRVSLVEELLKDRR